jgi:hypothetical protein
VILSSEGEGESGDSDSLESYHTPSPPFPPCAEGKHVTSHDLDYLPEDQPIEQPC